MIPTYIANIDDSETTGMFVISLVEDPAVESNWVKFNKDTQQMTFSIDNEEQRVITGVVMRANFPIYRNNPQYGEFYVKYSPETLKQMALKYFKMNQQNNVNMAHNPNNQTDKVNIFEMYIKDSERGIIPKGFEDIEDGSLMASFKVNDEVIWEDIKKGVFKGFSLEGVFQLVEETPSVESEIMEIISKIKEKINR